MIWREYLPHSFKTQALILVYPDLGVASSSWKLVATRMAFGLSWSPDCSRYPISSPTSTHLNFLRSISAIMSHVPYLLKFITAVMGRGGSLQRANSFGRGSVSRRLEVGANRKDLFYYLVRQRDIKFKFDMLISLEPITERRGAP